jgi:hypothetical protein
MDAAAERLTGTIGQVPLCAPACCGGATRPLTLSDYIDRGLRRRRAARLPLVGDVRRDRDDRFVRFSVRITDGVIDAVAFEATMCVTLIAYCEVAAMWATGLTVAAAARRIRPDALVEALPAVPVGTRHRALLAVQAMVATLAVGARRTAQ